MAQNNPGRLAGQTALVTGGARRIGASLVHVLHDAGADVVIHCHRSREAGDVLVQQLVARRADSASTVAADLRDPDACAAMVDQAIALRGRLDLVVNNASTFYPTPVGDITPEAFDDLVGTNLRAPAFVTQAAAPALRASGGCVVNLADIHGERALPGHAVYCSAKAGLIMLTRTLAAELAPEVRVNAIAPGSILWPEGAGDDPARRAQVLEATPLNRQGEPADVAAALLYLAADAPFVTGQVLAVDGGRGL